ncbi:MAG: LCP family protein [Clostridia bacterium]
MATIVFVSVLAGYINSKFDMISFTEDESGDTVTVVTEPVVYDEEDIEIMTALDSAGSLSDYLYQWANNGGELYSNKNVINVLVLGLDSLEALEEGGRSDTVMIVSLNKTTQEINLISLYRDTWTYMDINETDMYAKLNSSFFYGGQTSLIETVENDFKIEIDHYVAVDFNSFVDIIDALGGVTVEVLQYEAEYINSTTSQTIEYGDAVTLNGEEALVFARIRKSDSDSDVSRTRRQRALITALIESATDASLSELNSAVNSLFSYVATDLTKIEILSYATQALTSGWLYYDIVETTISDSTMFKTGYVGSYSVVLLDMPLVAQTIQLALYGDTNIVLEEDRDTVFDFVTGFS